MINKFRYRKPPQKQLGDKVIECVDADKNSGKAVIKDPGVKIKQDGPILSDMLDCKTRSKIRELFSQLQFSTETALPPDALRRALAESFFDQQRFQLGFMDDAAECFENMLLRIHQHVAHGQTEDACAAPHCVPHQKFAMTLVEQSVCGSCGATSEPLSYTQMVHYVSTSTLVYQVRNNAARTNPPDSFGKLLQKAASMGDVRSCPSSCGSVIQIGRSLMNHPEIVSIGLVWNSERPTLEHIMEVFSSIGTNLRLGDVFNSVVDTRWAETSIHNLVGVVTYYGKHYSTFFFHTKLRVWIYFDDATVREVGPRWEQVVEKCRKGRYQPLLLLYASPDGTPVNTESAPKQITPFYGDKKNSSHQIIRRSVTPSPEKPMIGNTRRAITPNPESSLLNQKPPLPQLSRPYNEYQNLSIIQKNIYPPSEAQSCDQIDGCNDRKEPDYMTRKALDFNKPHINVHRTLSNSSSSGIEGMCIPDHLNIPRRRDSGNWSGDRNSASSASSTTMENPYLYLVGKMPPCGGSSVPSSPTRIKSDSSSGSSGIYDAGYDSYSLSSNDSSGMSTLQHLMKIGHLAKIPEDYSNINMNQNSQSCDVLCDEADELLVKSRQLEDEHDLVLALALCNAAATKARAAMNAPYNNPQTLTLARMKHNTCIMRARSLHRRMTQNQTIQNKENPPEIRHTREGSSGSGRHSRQNSRDKGQHSRQNSKELLVSEKEKPKIIKNIEIYATLPKKKDNLKAKMNSINIDDEEYVLYDKPPSRESRSIFSRSKTKDVQKLKEKRSRSEDRHKLSQDFSIAPEIITGKDTLKKAKEEKDKDEKKDKDGKPKKQHKIRRKLLMGGLIKRKNRSMPDLTDANSDADAKDAPSETVDDSSVGIKVNLEPQQGINGYLSEGHLEFAGTNGNPNLERSKLMRKSFHSSAGKILTVAKVPPPPPLRTTSQLSTSKLNSVEVEENGERPQFPLTTDYQLQQNHYNDSYNDQVSMSLPYYHNNSNSSYDDDSYFGASSRTVVTHADVHQEQSSIKLSPSNIDSGVDEVDCLPSHRMPILELPPYPSPVASAIHSRQASEDFPPPPPPLDLSALDEHLPQLAKSESPEPPAPDGLLAQLQIKRMQIMTLDNVCKNKTPILPPIKCSGETWLKELQAKQAALRIKRNDDEQQKGTDEINTQRYLPGDAKIKSVRDLASQFENGDSNSASKITNMKPLTQHISEAVTTIQNNSPVLTVRRKEDETCTSVGPEQVAEEIREVEMLTSAVNKAFGLNEDINEENKKQKLGKKKSVSFCDQVILVATAEEQEDDSYIPNPILERVLRSAVNKPEAMAIRQEIKALKEQNDCAHQSPTPVIELTNNMSHNTMNENNQKPLYIRRNSLDNLLSNHNFNEANQSINNEMYQSHFANHVPSHQNYYSYATHNVQNTTNIPDSQYSHSQMHNQNLYNHSGICGNQIQHQNPQNHQYHRQYDHLNGQHVRHGDERQYLQIGLTESQYKTAQNCTNLGYHNQYIHEAPQKNIVNDMYNSNGHCNDPPSYRPSPYQPIPPNSQVYGVQYLNNRMQSSPVPRISQEHHNQNQTYSTILPKSYNSSQIRQATPSPVTFPNNPVYQHPPSPAPSLSSNYNYQSNIYRGPINNNTNHPTYQRLAPPNDFPQNFNHDAQQYNRGVSVNDRSEIYQRVPLLHGDPQDVYPQAGKHFPYQHNAPPKQLNKKTVSFEPGTKGCESPTPKPVVTPIIVNNANNSIPTDKTKCNLCRKKNVVAANLYCTDCEFYMSRFKPRS
ncbi:uncharacterized protein LOC132700784 isoform X2 [Cylas formicarius]|uniref:uncharacterized protein LOC132700784 isoform X2 n=1 Tax=Cylas formicarius TaxID=197179 RepID=UPI0029583657|nr:uncharacterized protein LOC132700784 isoform X2 [Cylas formicarius]